MLLTAQIGEEGGKGLGRNDSGCWGDRNLILVEEDVDRKEWSLRAQRRRKRKMVMAVETGA